MLPIVIASDHAGFSLKEQVKKYLEQKGIEYTDLGTNSAESVDYPLYASALCKEIQEGKSALGILVCGTGIGMSMVANKHKGIRAACVSDVFSAKATREHNDANIVAMGARVVGAGLATEIVRLFLTTPFSNDERHIRRIEKIEG